MMLSWGRAHHAEHAVSHPRDIDAIDLNTLAQNSVNKQVLARGMGRSYGDSPINDGGALIDMRGLDRIYEADWARGVVKAEAGLTLDALIKACVPKGWFPAVAPGTKYVTLGGAVANDVHGKNHHVAGSFGASVLSIGLKRSDGPDQRLSKHENSDLFALTLGGLGLTGLISWVELQLQPIASSELETETFRFDHLCGFFALAEASADWPYTVGWLDCFAPERQLGRGVFSRGRFAAKGKLFTHQNKALVWPVETPGFLLNRHTISAFNRIYKSMTKAGVDIRQHYDPFFFPLDNIRGWNKLYGRHGFFQYQCLLPSGEAREGVEELLRFIKKSGQGSFLCVIKNHGPETSPGRLTFAKEGTSLALDFANRGPSTLALMTALDAIVRRRGGRLYPAKDGRMAGDFFRDAYPAWRELEEARDPAISSSFWRRVTPIGPVKHTLSSTIKIRPAA